MESRPGRSSRIAGNPRLSSQVEASSQGLAVGIHSDETWWLMNQDFILGRLSEIMGWDTDRSRQEFDWLRLMSRMKYDGYQDFLAGMRFIESLADWIQQFAPGERKAVYG